MDDLKQMEWLTGNNSDVFSAMPLRTPGVLCPSHVLHQQLSATMGAFQKATREGFRLQDVHKAPLAKRRKGRETRKNSSGGEQRSGSSDSSNSSGSSGIPQLDSSAKSDSTLSQCLLSVRNHSDKSNGSTASQGSTYSTGFVPSSKELVTADSGPLMVSLDSTMLGDSESSSILIRSPSAESDIITPSSVESDIITDAQLFPTSRGMKRKKSSLESESYCSDDSDEEEDDCVIVDDSILHILPITLTASPDSKADPIIVDDI